MSVSLVSNLLGPKKQGFWSKINCSQMRLILTKNQKLHGLTDINIYRIHFFARRILSNILRLLEYMNLINF